MPNSHVPRLDGNDAPLRGLRVVCFESRRSAEASRLIARQGGDPIEAPSLREVPLPQAEGLIELESDLERKTPLLLVLMTGLGADLMVQGLSARSSKAHAVSLLGDPAAALICRGPKPHAVLKQLGIRPFVVVGEPNTWRDVLGAIDERDLLKDRAVYLQEYGRTNEELVAALAQRGVSPVRQVKTYAWALPEDLSPLEQAIDLIARGEAEVALFTSGVQLAHLLQVAEARGASDALRRGLSRLVIASVGPLTSEALRGAGLAPDIEPEHPKLGHLMLALGSAREKLAEKRRPA